MSKTNQLPAGGGAALPTLADLEGMEGAGLDNVRPEERGSSLLYLLQANAKAVNRGSEQHVPGAQAGMFFSTDSQRLYDVVEFVPVWREVKYLEWVPIDDGGGFKGTFEPDDAFVQGIIARSENGRFGDLKTDRGTELIETHSIYALIGEPGFGPEDLEMVAIPFTSIKIRHYNNWLKRARNIRYRVGERLITPAIFQHRWRLTAEFEQQWKPNGAWNVRVGLAGGDDPAASFLRAADPLCMLAKEMHEGFQQGLHRADYSKGDGASSTVGYGDTGPRGDDPAPPF